jgi:hypothetical protein
MITAAGTMTFAGILAAQCMRDAATQLTSRTIYVPDDAVVPENRTEKT